MRGEPFVRRDVRKIDTFQLTRPVRGEPVEINATRYGLEISTHSPRAGRTRILQPKCNCRRTFQLTRPVRGEP